MKIEKKRGEVEETLAVVHIDCRQFPRATTN